MNLRVTEERDTFVYATSPINFGGISKEDMLIWMVSMAMTSNITGDSLFSFFVGCSALYAYKKATAKKAPGFLVYQMSVSFGNWENSTWAKKLPPVLGVLRAINRVSARVWIENGLIPSYTHCNVYEP
ncbi:MULTISPECIES: hypothetical protein [Pseudomonas]|uniref:Uncharacterized protein n=1 Tax=Pseudomonas fluorescens TaxID=294 RepID=A0A166QP18_PSEFL|nr:MULTISPECIES: hypothetical protein [Pseudomonas]KZN20619.1 hypothetical protein A1D17_03510 [Pseudomonas fluorescens]